MLPALPLHFAAKGAFKKVPVGRQPPNEISPGDKLALGTAAYLIDLGGKVDGRRCRKSPFQGVGSHELVEIGCGTPKGSLHHLRFAVPGDSTVLLVAVHRILNSGIHAPDDSCMCRPYQNVVSAFLRKRILEDLIDAGQVVDHLVYSFQLRRRIARKDEDIHRSP